LVDILAISHASSVAINRAIYRELAKNGWKVEIVIPDKLKYPVGYINSSERKELDPPIYALPLSSNNPRLHTFKGLWRLLNRLKPKIIYLDNDPASRLSVMVGIWSGIHKSALVCQSCESMSRRLLAAFSRAGIKGLINSGLIQIISMLAKPNIEHIFVINTAGIQVFKELGYNGKISQIPLGFDSTLFYPDQQKREDTRKRFNLEKTTVAYFGMLREEKGVHLLIEVLASLMDLEWQLLMDRFGIYANPYSNYIKRLIHDKGISSRVVFFDARHEEMPYFMNAADIVVLPSISTRTSKEQYGRATSEAMACGCMVIVSDCGHLPDLISDAGLCFKENDIDSLRSYLRMAITNPQLRSSFGKKSYMRAHSELSVKRQAEIITEILSMNM
jgi:glycosyltransferase involved in cell wall biosynthesis